MKWSLGFLVGVFILTFMSVLFGWGNDHVSAESVWAAGDAKLESRYPRDTAKIFTATCGSTVMDIKVANVSGSYRACMYGEPSGTRVARYQKYQGGTPILTISFPSENYFYVVRDVCRYDVSCVYSQETDTLFYLDNRGTLGYDLLAYKNFSKNLKREFDPSTGGYYYTLNSGGAVRLNSGIQANLPVINMAVSKTGRWVALEYRGYGLVRIDAKDYTQKRVYAYTTENIRYEFSVTSDGEAIAGFADGAMPFIVAVNDTCGDYVRSGMGSTMPYYAEYCKTTTLSPQEYLTVPDYMFVTSGEFVDADRLHVNVGTRGGLNDVFVYAPASLINQDSRAVEYIALGDSFSSGEGEVKDSYYIDGTNSSPHTCHVSNRSYPYVISSIPLVGQRMNVACSGAVMDDILGTPKYNGQGGRLAGLEASDALLKTKAAVANSSRGIVPQIDYIKHYKPRHITIGIGGNDAGFMGKLKGCLSPGTCEWAKPGANRSAVAKEIDALSQKYSLTIDKLKQTSPESELVMVGYPQIISTEKAAKCDFVIGSLLDYDERLFISRSIERINSVIESVASDKSVVYKSIAASYSGHKLCEETNTPAMNGVRLGDDFSPVGSMPNLKIIGAESFHPTPYGHSLAAATIDGGVPITQFRSTMVDDYWGEQNSDGFRYALLNPGSINNADRGEDYTITVPDGTLAPGSKVSVSIQGKGDDSIEFTVEDSGGLNLKVRLPDVITAPVETIYIKGQTSSGEMVTLYEIVNINASLSDDPVNNDNPVAGDNSSGIIPVISSGSGGIGGAVIRSGVRLGKVPSPYPVNFTAGAGLGSLDFFANTGRTLDLNAGFGTKVNPDIKTEPSQVNSSKDSGDSHKTNNLSANWWVVVSVVFVFTMVAIFIAIWLLVRRRNAVSSL